MENNNNKYVTLSNGLRVHKDLVKTVKKNIMQAGQEQVQYELDDQKVF